MIRHPDSVIFLSSSCTMTIVWAPSINQAERDSSSIPLERFVLDGILKRLWELQCELGFSVGGRRFQCRFFHPVEENCAEWVAEVPRQSFFVLYWSVIATVIYNAGGHSFDLILIWILGYLCTLEFGWKRVHKESWSSQPWQHGGQPGWSRG